MKKILRIILIVSLFVLIFKTDFSIPKAQAAEVHLVQCNSLSQANTTYILDNDVTSAGTCFTITASNIVLDGQNYKITYATGGSVGYAVSFASRQNTEIKNLVIQVSPGNFINNAHGLYGYGSSYSNIHDNTIDVDEGTALDGAMNGIVFDWGNHNQVHNNTIYKRARSAGISFGQTYGNDEVYGNTIYHVGGHSGHTYAIYISAASGQLNPLGSKVHDNQIYIPYVSGVSGDGMGIGHNDYANLIQQHASTNVEIYNNYIEDRDEHARAIVFDDVSSDKVYNNTIIAENHQGIRIRAGNYIELYNNNISHKGGTGALVIGGNQRSSETPGYNFSDWNVGNNIHDNIFNAENTPAVAYDASSSFDDGLKNTIFKNNQFNAKGTTKIVSLIEARNDIYEGNIFTVTDGNPSTSDVDLAWWAGEIQNIIFLDNTWAEKITGSAGRTWEAFVKYSLTVTVKDSSNNPIQGALVSAVSTGAGSETVSGTSDAQGIAKLTLTKFKKTNSGQTTYTPHTIIATKTDVGQAQTQVFMDYSKSIELVLSPAISLVKQVDKSSASSGEVLTYIMNYSNNNSTETYTNIILEDPIPAGTTYVSGSATNNAQFDGTKVIWNLGNLAAGASGSVQFQITVQ